MASCNTLPLVASMCVYMCWRVKWSFYFSVYFIFRSWRMMPHFKGHKVSLLSNPSRAVASVLATHFPAQSDNNNIITKGYWKPKKRSTVVLLEKFSSSVPKGKARQELSSRGRLMSIRFTRTMSSQSIREQIEGEFNINSFTVLECNSTGHQLIKAAEQDFSRCEVVSRKGYVNLSLR